ncbi:MAG: HAMP domain-containing protein [Chloroflexi bacterium]|nr:HAMP domain-containing protein [Chloroflexota bacterium]
MRRSLKSKMILSYLAVALLTVLVVTVFIQLTSGQSLMNLVAEQQTTLLKETVQDYYTTNGTLDGVFDYYLQTIRKDAPPQSDSGSRPPKRDIRGVYGLIDTEGRALFPAFGLEIGESVPADRRQQAIAVDVDGQTIAWILPDTSAQFKLSPDEELFLQRTTLATALAALAGVTAAVATGFFLAGRLLKPIRQLTIASQSLARGDLNQQVPVTSRDELGQLTATFNQMSADLAQADQQRKRMTADITHDLSTPLQIIAGYIEMLEEGEVKLTPQRLDIIKTEIGHLRRLVGDLSTLSQVEAGALDIQLQPVYPAELLQRVYRAYQPIAARQEVALTLDVAEAAPPILVDEGRMVQVLKNLIENALRYTPRGGTIQLGAVVGDRVQLRLKDSGAGIDADDLPYVFDRFYRADKARGANSGKLGLGLAICKALVTAQGGGIAAESDGKDRGATIVMTFDRSSVPEG